LARIERAVSFTGSYSSKIDDHLLQCNKTVLIVQDMDLESEFLRLRKLAHPNAEKVYYGRGRFMPHPRIWAIGTNQWDRMGNLYKRIHYLIHSGIFYHLSTNLTSHRILSSIARKNLAIVTEVQPMSFDHNFIISSFVLFFVCIGVSAFAFVSEKTGQCWQMCKKRKKEKAAEKKKVVKWKNANLLI